MSNRGNGEGMRDTEKLGQIPNFVTWDGQRVIESKSGYNSMDTTIMLHLKQEEWKKLSAVVNELLNRVVLLQHCATVIWA